MPQLDRRAFVVGVAVAGAPGVAGAVIVGTLTAGAVIGGAATAAPAGGGLAALIANAAIRPSA